MQVYSVISRVPVFRSLSAKVLTVCFIGMHLPLLAFAVYAFVFLPLDQVSFVALVVILCATLVGTALTLFIVNGLLYPLRAATAGLEQYRSTGVIPDLPTELPDDMGEMLSAVHSTLVHLDDSLHKSALMATTDHLTGIGNRRWLLEAGAEALATAQAAGTPIATVIFDLDGFKRLNDQEGHAAGDLALIETARLLRKSMPPNAVFGRWGGDEFCIILVGSDLQEAEHIMSEFLDFLRELPPTAWPRGMITASVGIATVRSSDDSISRSILRADASLYRAKALGKDRIAMD